MKRLSDEKRIDWQPYKTPTQYINEVRIPVFRQLTNHFLRVRYGNFEGTEELFNSMKSLQEEIGKGGLMRGSRWFIFFVLAFLLLMFAIEYHLPKKFVWVPTFSHYDEQPFGCAVFDSLLTVSLPSGYTLSRKTFYQMEQEDTVHNKGILLIATNLPFGRVDIEALLKMADRGNKIVLVAVLLPRFWRIR